MSELFAVNADSTQSISFYDTDSQMDSLMRLDKQIIFNKQLAGNIDFLRKQGLYSLSHRIIAEIEKSKFEIEDFFINENRNELYGIVRKYFENFTLQQLKVILGNKS